jgi:branched-chain amino acid transport system ATP-binding protein
VEEKELIALIGPNGSGKTTLFNIISGFLKPDQGKITFKGIKINGISPNKVARLGIARTFQKIRLFHQLSVLDNMLLATKYEKGEKLSSALFRKHLIQAEEEKNIKKSLEYLSFVGLSEKKDALGENLSFGQRKLLELAMAFASDADLVLFDEPTSGVFPETKAKIIKIIQKLNEDGKTIIFIEHDMELVTLLAKRIVVLDHGKMIADGSPEEIINNERVLDAYFGMRKSYA